MAETSREAVIRGIESRPDVNMRGGPGTGHELLFKAPKGTSAQVIDALRDAVDNSFQGKIYQWLKLHFADGREAWVRDDLVDLKPGDFSSFGYGVVTQQALAFALTRDESKRPTPAETTFPPAITQGSEIEAQPAAETPDTGSSLFVPADSSEAPVAEPAPAATPSAEPAAAPEPVETPGCTITVIGARSGVNVRSGPSTNFAVAMRMPLGATSPALEVRPQEGGGDFKWVKVTHQGQEGWIREDLLHFEGAACEGHGLLTPGLYASPMALGKYWWVRGFTGPQPNHPGWDLGANRGEPVLAGPGGGVVITAFRAAKATPDKPRTLDHGLSLGDPSVFSDAGWGFGYGHYVIVRYTNDQLPTATRAELATRGFDGAAISVLYAHLNSVDVSQGQAVSGGQQIGTCGTTGNAEAEHVHLEIRAHKNAAETSWARMSGGLMDPGVLFAK